MKESIIERTMKPLPAPFEEFEEFSTPMPDFFDLIARRPFEHPSLDEDEGQRHGCRPADADSCRDREARRARRSLAR